MRKVFPVLSDDFFVESVNAQLETILGTTGGTVDENIAALSTIKANFATSIVRKSPMPIEGQPFSSYPSAVLYIPDGAKLCSSIVLDNSIEEIGLCSFVSCTHLSSVQLPSALKKIGDYAFYRCSALTSVSDIPDSVTHIGRQAFSNCSSLTSVHIGSGVVELGVGAFAFCPLLTSLTIEATTPPHAYTNTLQGSDNCIIYVPAESLETYLTEWSDWASRIQAIPA